MNFYIIMTNPFNIYNIKHQINKRKWILSIFRLLLIFPVLLFAIFFSTKAVSKEECPQGYEGWKCKIEKQHTDIQSIYQRIIDITKKRKNGIPLYGKWLSELSSSMTYITWEKGPFGADDLDQFLMPKIIDPVAETKKKLKKGGVQGAPPTLTQKLCISISKFEELKKRANEQYKKLLDLFVIKDKKKACIANTDAKNFIDYFKDKDNSPFPLSMNEKCIKTIEFNKMKNFMNEEEKRLLETIIIKKSDDETCLNLEEFLELFGEFEELSPSVFTENSFCVEESNLKNIEDHSNSVRQKILAKIVSPKPDKLGDSPGNDRVACVNRKMIVNFLNKVLEANPFSLLLEPFITFKGLDPLCMTKLKYEEILLGMSQEYQNLLKFLTHTESDNLVCIDPKRLLIPFQQKTKEQKTSREYFDKNVKERTPEEVFDDASAEEINEIRPFFLPRNSPYRVVKGYKMPFCRLLLKRLSQKGVEIKDPAKHLEICNRNNYLFSSYHFGGYTIEDTVYKEKEDIDQIFQELGMLKNYSEDYVFVVYGKSDYVPYSKKKLIKMDTNAIPIEKLNRRELTKTGWTEKKIPVRYHKHKPIMDNKILPWVRAYCIKEYLEEINFLPSKSERKFNVCLAGKDVYDKTNRKSPNEGDKPGVQENRSVSLWLFKIEKIKEIR